RLDPLLRREGEGAHHDAAHVVKRHVSRLDCPVGLDDGRVPVREEERLLVRDVQRCPLTGDQPVPAERRLKGVAVEAGLAYKHAALGAPIPLVSPVAAALLAAWAAPRTRRLRGGGHLAARRDYGIALLLRDRRRGDNPRTAATTATDEVGQAGGAGQVPDRLAPDHRGPPRVFLGG